MSIEIVANEEDLRGEGYAVATVFVTHKDDGNTEVRILNVSYDAEQRMMSRTTGHEKPPDA
jgi:hypothetical protein